ncbi:MAG: hypothetical protein M3P93_12610 [Actinomycetota bacterium]|nr:hypothetical protein [Actinomycetota bacterium]
MLFFTQPITHSVLSIASTLNPDIRAIRANDYARMFAFPLPGAQWNNAPRPTAIATQVNRDFAPILEAFLAESWRGIVNRNNSTGANSADDAAIARLATRLFDMLTTMRRYGNVDRHEFVHVTTFEFFFQTLMADYPVIRDLRAEASSGYERLRNVAAAVGMRPHPHGDQFLRLAETLPRLLRLIETGLLNTNTNAGVVYAGVVNPVRDLIEDVLVNWIAATGRDLKNQVTLTNEIRTLVPPPRSAAGPLSSRAVPQPGAPFTGAGR